MKFKSTIYQDENGILHVSKLYEDIHTFLDVQRKRLNMSEDDKFDRGHPLQHVLNSTSGGYISPTAMKSFEMCPAGYLYNKLVPEKTGTATSIGRTFHTIMERFYQGEDRSREELDRITDQTIEEDGQQDDALSVKRYVDGYWDSPDYLDLSKPFDHEHLICSTETFIKPIIKPLGVDLGVPVYLLVDRVDIRDDGIFVVDYKTGFGDPNPYLLGAAGYLPQMIFYKWGVEAEYGQEVSNVYLSLPGADSDKYKFTKMNVNSLVEQSKVVEAAHKHIEHARRNREKKEYESCLMRYCGSCALKYHCITYLKEKGLSMDDYLEEIPVEMDIEDSTEG